MQDKTDIFLSQTGDSPCPNPSAPADIPVIELRRRLGVVHDYYVGLTDFVFLPALWSRQPDTIRFCQIMDQLRGQLEGLRVAVEEAERHASLLFDLSFNEGERRGVHGADR